jgi:hypothetical protein
LPTVSIGKWWYFESLLGVSQQGREAGCPSHLMCSVSQQPGLVSKAAVLVIASRGMVPWLGLCLLSVIISALGPHSSVPWDRQVECCQCPLLVRQPRLGTGPSCAEAEEDERPMSLVPAQLVLPFGHIVAPVLSLVKTGDHSTWLTQPNSVLRVSTAFCVVTSADQVLVSGFLQMKKSR